MSPASASGLALLAFALVTRAASADDQTTLAAEASFAEGLRLMKDNHCEEAVTKFQESQRLDAASGTALDLAYCQVQLGRVASAWLTYRQAFSLAEVQNKPEHQRLAAEQAEKLAPEVPQLQLVLNGDAQGALSLELDNATLPRAAWPAPVPVDPGKHTLVAVVGGKSVWQQTLSLTRGERATLVLPHFEPVAPSRPRGAPPSDQRPTRTSNVPYVALSSAGLALLALSAGVITGSIATAPPGGDNRAERQADLARRGKYATSANVCFVAGGVLSAVAVVTFVWR